MGPQLEGPENEKFEVMQGENILLPCEVTGTPRPVVQWRQNFSPFTPRSPRFQFQDSGLYVQDARVEDKAIYECIASNEAGNVTKVITLIVYSECGLLPGFQPLNNTMQYNFVVECPYNCTRNILWCQVHSSHIHSNHETLNYNNSK